MKAFVITGLSGGSRRDRSDQSAGLVSRDVERWVPDDLPEVAVWVVEVPRVDAPGPVVGGVDDGRPGCLGLFDDVVDFVPAGHHVPDAELAGLLLATGYFAILSQWIASEPAPFDLESRLLNMVDLQYAGLR